MDTSCVQLRTSIHKLYLYTLICTEKLVEKHHIFLTNIISEIVINPPTETRRLSQCKTFYLSAIHNRQIEGFALSLTPYFMIVSHLYSNRMINHVNHNFAVSSHALKKRKLLSVTLESKLNTLCKKLYPYSQTNNI